MVSEVQVDDDRAAHEILKDSEGSRGRRNGPPPPRDDHRYPPDSERRHAGDREGDIYRDMPCKKMIALYDYDPTELSPNVDSEVRHSLY